VSKLAEEEAARVLARRHQLPLMIARIFNPVGPGEDERHLCGRLAAQVAAIEAGVVEPSVRVGPLESTRDFVDVRDVAQALFLLAHVRSPGAIYNVASGVETPTESVLTILIGLAGLDDRIKVDRQAGRPGDIPRHFAEIARLNQLGFRPRHALGGSLRDLLDYYRNEVAQAVASLEARESDREVRWSPTPSSSLNLNSRGLEPESRCRS
jgi:GDP-4-dehydro-6-deoxy-D-mannose reductase